MRMLHTCSGRSITTFPANTHTPCFAPGRVVRRFGERPQADQSPTHLRCVSSTAPDANSAVVMCPRHAADATFALNTTPNSRRFLYLPGLLLQFFPLTNYTLSRLSGVWRPLHNFILHDPSWQKTPVARQQKRGERWSIVAHGEQLLIRLLCDVRFLRDELLPGCMKPAIRVTSGQAPVGNLPISKQEITHKFLRVVRSAVSLEYLWLENQLWLD